MCNICLHLDINWLRIWLILLNISSSGFHECRHINTSSFSKCAPASFSFPNESAQEKYQHACDAPEAGFGSSTSFKPEIFNIRSTLPSTPWSHWATDSKNVSWTDLFAFTSHADVLPLYLIYSWTFKLN